MKHYFVIKAYENDILNSLPDLGNQIANLKIPTTKLQGKSLSLSFEPASNNDKSLLLNFIKTDENGNTNLDLLPTKLSTNINLRGKIKLDNKELHDLDSTYKLGVESIFYMGFESPNLHSGLVRKKVTAGEYHAIGYNLQGISTEQLEKLSDRLTEIKSKLDSKQKIDDDITGKILQTGVQTYFAYNDKQSLVMQGQTNVIQHPYMSFGTYSTHLNTLYRYGLPFATSSTGTVMDIDNIKFITVDRDNKVENSLAFLKAEGYLMSMNEHRIPEALFNTDEQLQNVRAVSAVKALQIAMNEEQKVYVITKNNQNEVLSKLNHDKETMQDITNALSQGKIVTVSERPVNYSGWQGSGYIIESLGGGGAYMISGGLNGGNAIASDGAGDMVLAGMNVITEVKPDKVKVNFMGIMECDLDKKFSLLIIGILLAFLAAYFTPSIRGMLAIPELAPLAVESFRMMLVGAFTMLGMTNANAANNLQNCKCASGIYGNDPTPKSQCWICHPNLHPISTARVEQAKAATQRLGKCVYQGKNVTIEYLNERVSAWSKLVDVREEHNTCYDKLGPRHKQARDDALIVVQNCLSMYSKLKP